MGAGAPLIAVVGMVREAKILAGLGVTVVVGGGDSAGLERRLEVARRASAVTEGASPTLAPSVAGPDGPPTAPPFCEQGSRRRLALLSFGVCGALAPGLKAGDLVIGAGVVSAGVRWPADPAWTERLRAALPHAVLADIAGVDVMVGSAAEKRALHEATGAVAVDMESHIVARIAERHGLPFAVLRAVSDGPDHTLPPAALAGLRPDGRPDIWAVLRALAARPGQLPALIQTAREAQAAFRALERAPVDWLPGSQD